MEKYVMFLRGVNLGNKNKISMSSLSKYLEDSGLKNIKTVLNSGNIIFDSDLTNEILTKNIMNLIENKFNLKIKVMIFKSEEISNLVENNPFSKVTNDNARLYVTFLSDSKTYFRLPKSLDSKFPVLSSDGKFLFSVLFNQNSGTPELMSLIEKKFGKKLTTRNWNTIKKIVDLIENNS